MSEAEHRVCLGEGIRCGTRDGGARCAGRDVTRVGGEKVLYSCMMLFILNHSAQRGLLQRIGSISLIG
jgi:hypothetical protein